MSKEGTLLRKCREAQLISLLPPPPPSKGAVNIHQIQKGCIKRDTIKLEGLIVIASASFQTRSNSRPLLSQPSAMT